MEVGAPRNPGGVDLLPSGRQTRSDAAAVQHLRLARSSTTGNVQPGGGCHRRPSCPGNMRQETLEFVLVRQAATGIIDAAGCATYSGPTSCSNLCSPPVDAFQEESDGGLAVSESIRHQGGGRRAGGSSLSVRVEGRLGRFKARDRASDPTPGCAVRPFTGHTARNRRSLAMDVFLFFFFVYYVFPFRHTVLGRASSFRTAVLRPTRRSLSTFAERGAAVMDLDSCPLFSSFSVGACSTLASLLLLFWP